MLIVLINDIFFTEPDYYVYEGVKLNFHATGKLCRSKGQIMAMPKTSAEMQNFKTYLDGKSERFVWLGLRVNINL